MRARLEAWLLLGALAAAPVAASSLDPPPPLASPSDDVPAPFRDAGIEQRIGAALPLDLPWRDEEGREVRLGDYFGDKPVILAPVYFACPMLCPLTLEGLSRSLKVLAFAATDYELVVFSFDPREGPEQAAAKKAFALERYGREGGEAGWHFLTGSEESVRRLTEALGFRFAWDEATGQFVHAAAVVVATPGGEVARYFYGVEHAPKDLRLALVEASDGRLGNPIDSVLLYCFHYDPATAKYTAVTMRVVRLAGAVTLLALVTVIGAMVARERRAARRTAEGLS